MEATWELGRSGWSGSRGLILICIPHRQKYASVTTVQTHAFFTDTLLLKEHYHTLPYKYCLRIVILYIKRIS